MSSQNPQEPAMYALPPSSNVCSVETVDPVAPEPASPARTLGTAPLDRFPPDEEARLLAAAQLQKASGNRLYTTQHPQAAVDAYHLALSSTPIYLLHETSILHSNLAACFLKLEKWEKALEHAQKAAEERPGWARPLIRRARAKEGLGTWKDIESAVEDYEALLKGEVEGVKIAPDLTVAERKEVNGLLAGARPKLEKARSEGVGEVMKGLKELGNGLLKPFGMSTDDFGFVKDEKTGGYSMQMNRGGG